MRMDLREHRASPEQSEWELPPWGHPIAQGVMPLFISVHGRLFPIGTAFTTGQLHFVVTATHNIEQIIARDPRFQHRISRGRLDGAHELSDGHALYVLHHRAHGNAAQVTLWPLRKIDGASPTDVVFASPQYAGEIQTLISPLSFDIPAIDEVVLSVGYSEFSCPDDGIEFAAIKSGAFDWANAYRHRLFVVEGTVRRIFTRQFSSGYVAGPCFAFSPEIRHGMSGGPIYNAAGNVCGVNSAGASMYFNEPMSLGSLLYPMLTRTLRFGAEMGPITFNASRPMIQLIDHGTIKTDGSEQHIALTHDETTGALMAHPRSHVADRDYVHDDFSSYQAGRQASKLAGEYMVLRKTKPGADDSPTAENAAET